MSPPPWPYALVYGAVVVGAAAGLLLPHFLETTQARAEEWVMLALLPAFAAGVWGLRAPTDEPGAPEPGPPR